MSTVNSSTPAAPITRTVGTSGASESTDDTTVGGAVAQRDLAARPEKAGTTARKASANGRGVELRARRRSLITVDAGSRRSAAGRRAARRSRRRRRRPRRRCGGTGGPARRGGPRGSRCRRALVVVAHDGAPIGEIGRAQELRAGLGMGPHTTPVSASARRPGLVRISGGRASLPTSWSSSPRPSLSRRSSIRSGDGGRGSRSSRRCTTPAGDEEVPARRPRRCAERCRRRGAGEVAEHERGAGAVEQVARPSRRRRRSSDSTHRAAACRRRSAARRRRPRSAAPVARCTLARVSGVSGSAIVDRLAEVVLDPDRADARPCGSSSA